MKLRWKDYLMGAGSIFGLYLAIHYWGKLAGLIKGLLSASGPLILGCAIAYLVNIVMAAYERKFCPNSTKTGVIKLRRPVCMLLAYLTLVAIVALVFGLILPQLADCIRIIIDAFPGFMEKAIALANEWKIFDSETLQSLQAIDWKSQVGKLVEFVGSGLGSVVDVLFNAVSSVFSWVVTALLAVIFSIYLLLGKETLASQADRILKRYLSRKLCSRIEYFVNVLDDCFHRYIVGQCTEAVILGILCAVGMAILRLPYAMMIGALVAFTALIPVAGAYIGAGVGAFMILTVDPFDALIFIIFLVILQQLEGNLIYPKVVGSSMGLPGIWVLAAVTVGGGLAGVLGMFLGVPLAATAYRILRDDVNKHTPAEIPEQPETEENNPAS